MVQIFAPLLAATLLFSGVLAVPTPDSSINEPAVSAPNGIPITEGSAVGTGAAKVAYEAPMATTSAAMMQESSSAKMMQESSSKKMMEESSTKKMMEETSTKMMEATSTKKESAAPTSTMYGSGSSGKSSYDNCIMQCMNTYGGAPAAQYTPPPSTKSSESGSGDSGNGKTHTVIVAPKKGVLRFVPFALNATSGDTVHYVWGAGPHTVTKGSQLEPCNKTSDGATFTSGSQNATFTFDQKVNDTNPVFYFCNVPGHCQKGMFGILNPPNANAPTVTTTVAQMMPAWIANSSTLAALNAYTVEKTKGSPAFNWGAQLDVANVPTWAHAEFATNVMYTRLLYAANPGMMEAGNGATNANGSPLTLPSDDFESLIASSASGAAAPPTNAASPASESAVPSSTASPSASGTAAAASATTSVKSSGASAVIGGSNGAFAIGIVAVLTTLLAF
jgi:plastocyanin